MRITAECQKCILTDRHKCKDCKNMTPRQAFRVLEATIEFARQQADAEWHKLTGETEYEKNRQITDKEREVWDRAAQLNFLHERIHDLIPSFHNTGLLEILCSEKCADCIQSCCVDFSSF